MASCPTGPEAEGIQLRRKNKLDMFKKNTIDKFVNTKEYLNTEISSAIDGMVMAHKILMTGNNPVEDSVLRIDDALNNTDDFIKSVLGKSKKEFSEIEIKRLTERMKDYTQRMVAVGLDPHKVIEDDSISEGYRFILNRMYKSDKGDFGPFAIGKRFPALLKSFVVNRIRFFKKFRPSFEIISKKNRLKTFLLTGKTVYINAAQELIIEQSKLYHLKEKSVNALLPLLNGLDGRPAKNLSPAAIEKNKAVLHEFKKTITKSPDANEDEVDSFVDIFLRIKDKWDILNYGEKYMLGEAPEPAKDSVVGFYNDALKMYSKLFEERTKYEGSSPGEYKIDNVERELNDVGIGTFNYKRGYVPGQGENPTSLMVGVESKFPKLMRVLHHQDFSGDRADFVNSFIEGMMDFTYKLETVATLTSLGAINGALNKYTQWGRQNPAVKNIILHYTTNMWKHITDTRTVGTKTEIFRNFLHPLTMAAGPLMLLHPATGITNVIAGRLLMGLKLGKDMKTVDKIYQQALTDPSNINHEIAIAVEAIARREFLDTGNIQDFQIQKTSKANSDSAMLNFSRDIHNGIVGIEDATTKKGLLGILKLTDAFSLKNTEEKQLRNTIAPLLFDQAQMEVAVMIENKGLPKGKSMAEIVGEILDKGGDNIHDDLNAALGHFDPENKPFWSWMGVSSPNAGKVAIGSLANAWYQFKHVAVNNTYAMKDLAIAANPFKRKGSRNIFYREYLSHLDAPGGGSLMILLALAGFRAAAFLAGLTGSRKSMGIVFPVLRNINPLQEIQTMSELGLSMVHKHLTAPLLNLPVNEKEFEYILRENLQLAGGVIAGGSLDDMVEKQYADKPLYSAYFDGVSNNIMAIGDAFSAESYVERRKAVFNALNNPHPLTNYSNDFLSLASRLVLQISPVTDDETPNRYGNTPADQDRYKKTQDLGKMLQVISGINWYTHPALWKDVTIGGEYKMDWALKRMQNNRKKMGFNDLNEEIYYQMIKHKRVYYSSIVRKMVKGGY